MNELKPEDVIKIFSRYEIVAEKIGAITLPYGEIKGINTILREKDAKIAELQSIAEFQQSSNMKRWFELQEKDKQIEEKDAEIERLNGVIETMEDRCTTCDNMIVDRISTARAEAITEFAEMANNALNDVARWSKNGIEGEYLIIGKSFIDKIEKKMKEEKNA